MFRRIHADELIDEKARQFMPRRVKRNNDIFVPSLTQYENIQEKGFFWLKFYNTSSKV